jgi:DnaJ-class molecular chaperone
MSYTRVSFFARIISDYSITFSSDNRLLNGDIEKDLEISPFMMMLGGTIKLHAIDGSTIEVTIPAGLEANKLLRLEGRGYWTDETCRFRGNCYLRIIPEIKNMDNIPVEELRIFINAAKSRHPNI